MTDERKREYTMRISQANSSKLIVILYEMLEDYIQEAMEAADDRAAFRDALRKAKGCIRELADSLNMQYEVAGNLYQLYRYVHRQLVAADVQNRKEPLTSCMAVIGSLHEAYEEISRSDESEPLLDNTQTVYAGLTYGRDDVNENLSYQGVNRGFRA